MVNWLAANPTSAVDFTGLVHRKISFLGFFDRHSRTFLAGIYTCGCPITTFGHDG